MKHHSKIMKLLRDANDNSSTSSGEGQIARKKTKKAADSPNPSHVDRFLANHKKKETKQDNKVHKLCL